ncbi:MAG: Hsp70 family protein [Anaerolineae bacterium]|nr:Hsp70 family protein [Anaerolineae bacterium]
MAIIGIDLGTTFSAASVVYDGVPVLLPNGDERLLPSVVGVSPDGDWLVGTPALNQYALYPDQTVRSVKRLMGTDAVFALGGYQLNPAEISALILREVKRVAEVNLGQDVAQAVITVPAYFTNAQRQATTLAGQLAGLDVVRIINEPTAAALAFGLGEQMEQTALVYDLGGGTFDVSLVEIVNGVIDVRASHGDTRLGGDDFDERLAEYLVHTFAEQHGVDLRGDRRAMARIRRAAEAAKIDLSSRMFTWVREEYLAERRGAPLHLEVELSREQFVSLIQDILLRTAESIDKVLADGEVETPDTVLLVGGSTYIPAVWELVAEQTGVQPRQDVRPSEAVALGAGIQGAIIEGQPIDAVLVDVSPHALGVAVVNFTYAGDVIPDSYKVLIRRNTTIPVTVEEVFSTISADQNSVEIEVYQGEHPVASQNVRLGAFVFEGLEPEAPGDLIEFPVQFSLDLNGILEVYATDRRTGRQHGIRVATDRQRLSQAEIRQAMDRLPPLSDPGEEAEEDLDAASDALHEEAEALLERAERLLETRDDPGLAQLVESIEAAMEAGDNDELRALLDVLLDFLYEQG